MELKPESGTNPEANYPRSKCNEKKDQNVSHWVVSFVCRNAGIRSNWDLPLFSPSAFMGHRWGRVRGMTMENSEFFYRSPDTGLQALRVGETVTIEGVTRRVSAIRVETATEDDPELDIKVGDWVYSLEFD